MRSHLSLLSLISFAICALAATPAIVHPAEGTQIAPGSAFNFTYNSIADYGTSSYNYTVWMYTSLPGSFSPSETFASGYFFGRFAQSNYPGNPNPTNPPPPQLVMPDFSLLPGGFGIGTNPSAVPVYLAVMEEYGNGDHASQGSIGYKISLQINELVYN